MSSPTKAGWEGVWGEVGVPDGTVHGHSPTDGSSGLHRQGGRADVGWYCHPCSQPRSTEHRRFARMFTC